MLIILFCIILFTLILIKLLFHFLALKYGKISYKNFQAFGFQYDTKRDIFYSSKNAWQKYFGYTHFYDVMAPLFRMIIDTESVRFSYNNKNWLIAFWKGQYGIVTGAEIGIYCTNEKKITKKTMYYPVDNKEMLNIDLILSKNGKIITKVSDKHWWLAVFKLGMFSQPKDLTVDINITFLDIPMLEAFLTAFKKLGYKDNDYKIFDKTLCFRYNKPKSPQVWTRSWLPDKIRQYFNRKNVELYNSYLSDVIDNFPNNENKIIMINDYLPAFIKNYDDNSLFLDKTVYSSYKKVTHD